MREFRLVLQQTLTVKKIIKAKHKKEAIRLGRALLKEEDMFSLVDDDLRNIVSAKEVT